MNKDQQLVSTKIELIFSRLCLFLFPVATMMQILDDKEHQQLWESVCRRTMCTCAVCRLTCTPLHNVVHLEATWGPLSSSRGDVHHQYYIRRRRRRYARMKKRYSDFLHGRLTHDSKQTQIESSLPPVQDIDQLILMPTCGDPSHVVCVGCLRYSLHRFFLRRRSRMCPERRFERAGKRLRPHFYCRPFMPSTFPYTGVSDDYPSQREPHRQRRRQDKNTLVENGMDVLSGYIVSSLSSCPSSRNRPLLSTTSIRNSKEPLHGFPFQLIWPLLHPVKLRKSVCQLAQFQC
jgi:hypothetical protein